MYCTVKLNQQTYLDRHNIITVNNLKKLSKRFAP